jgi:hypothetical protein
MEKSLPARQAFFIQVWVQSSLLKTALASFTELCLEAHIA